MLRGVKYLHLVPNLVLLLSVGSTQLNAACAMHMGSVYEVGIATSTRQCNIHAHALRSLCYWHSWADKLLTVFGP